MEDCPCLVVFFTSGFYCFFFFVVVSFFPCCLFLFLLFLLLLVAVAICGGAWCLVLVVMLVIIAISRHWHGRMVRRWNFSTFDSGSWKRRWAHHATRRDAFWSISGCQNAQNGILFFVSPPGRCWFGLYWDMIYTIYVAYMCLSCLFLHIVIFVVSRMSYGLSSQQKTLLVTSHSWDGKHPKRFHSILVFVDKSRFFKTNGVPRLVPGAGGEMHQTCFVWVSINPNNRVYNLFMSYYKRCL